MSMNPTRALPCLLLLVTSLGAASRYSIEDVPAVWGSEASAPTISSGLSVRQLTGDEPWQTDLGPVQLLHTGAATRTIVLPPIGADGLEAGSVLMARVTTAPAAKILFRKSNGELIAFWGDEQAEQTQWVRFEATTSGWKTRVSQPAFASISDGVFTVLGANLVPEATGAARPDSPRTVGYALRFRTNARQLLVAAEGRSIRFRVLADDVLIARVAIERETQERTLVPVSLGSEVANRRIEILADELVFAGIETPDTSLAVREWSNAVPMVRTLWITDDTANAGTQSYPWAAARLLKHDVWCRNWGTAAAALVGEDQNPTAVPVDAIRQDIAAINPDVIVVSGSLFDTQLQSKDYARVVGDWLEAIDAALRPDTVRYVVWTDVSRDRDLEKLAGILHKQARRRDFEFADWHDWIQGTPDAPESGNAHRLISGDGVHPTDLGNRFLGYCFASDFKRLGADSKAQTASVLRRQASGARNLAAAEDQR